MEKNELFVESAGDKTLIRYEDGNYYMDKYMVPFKDAESVIRLANLTNFAKVNFANRATTNVEKAWFIANDGDLTFDPKTTWDAFRKGDVRGMLSNITILDGEDGYKSAIKKLG
ncbi:hypothetical protein KBC03_01580 [Patescibacteria group bacterium]|nr:hypothetical protein [Patescibacteria group bacterium]